MIIACLVSSSIHACSILPLCVTRVFSFLSFAVTSVWCFIGPTSARVRAFDKCDQKCDLLLSHHLHHHHASAYSDLNPLLIGTYFNLHITCLALWLADQS